MIYWSEFCYFASFLQLAPWPGIPRPNSHYKGKTASRMFHNLNEHGEISHTNPFITDKANRNKTKLNKSMDIWSDIPYVNPDMFLNIWLYNILWNISTSVNSSLLLSRLWNVTIHQTNPKAGSSGDHPTEDIMIKFQIWWKHSLPLFKEDGYDNKKILHILRHLCCLDMYKMSLWSDRYEWK